MVRTAAPAQTTAPKTRVCTFNEIVVCRGLTAAEPGGPQRWWRSLQAVKPNDPSVKRRWRPRHGNCITKLRRLQLENAKVFCLAWTEAAVIR
jgi:hypothetical protein